MKMVEVKTAELIGSALDWAVAQVEGRQVTPLKTGLIFGVECGHLCQYSTSWRQGGPLIDKYKVCTGWIGDAPIAFMLDHKYKDGVRVAPTPLIAACRAIVAAKLGDVVSVPAELVNGGGV